MIEYFPSAVFDGDPTGKQHIQVATANVDHTKLTPSRRIHEHCLAMSGGHLKRGNSLNGQRFELAIYDGCVAAVPDSTIYFNRRETLSITQVPGDAVDTDIIVLKGGTYWCLHCKTSLRERWGQAGMAALMIRFGPYIRALLEERPMTFHIEDAPLMRNSKHILVTWREHEKKKYKGREVPWTAEDQNRYCQGTRKKIIKCGLPNLFHTIVSPFNTEDFDALFQEMNESKLSRQLKDAHLSKLTTTLDDGQQLMFRVKSNARQAY